MKHYTEVILSCLVAVSLAAQFSDQDLELQQEDEELSRITRSIHHEPFPRPRPSTFPRPRPTPTFPRPSPAGPSRYARSALDEIRYPRDTYGGGQRGTGGQIGTSRRFKRSEYNEQDGRQVNFDEDQLEQLTRNARYAQWGPPKDRRLTPPLPSSLPRQSSFPGQFPKTPSSFPSRRFKRSALNEQDIESEIDADQFDRYARSLSPGPWQIPKPSPTFPRPPNSGRFRRSADGEQDGQVTFNEDQLEQLTRNARYAQWGPPKDRRLTPPLPSSLPRQSSFPGQFPKTPSSFPSRRFKRSALNEQDIESEIDSDQLERFARSLRPGPWERPRPSPTFPRPPTSNPGRYIRSPSRVYDANMSVPKVVTNFGGRRN